MTARAKYRIEGIEEVTRAMNEQVKEMKTKSAKGLINAGIEIRHLTEKETPITPLDLGNLRASFHVTTSKGQEGTRGSFKGKESSEMQSNHGRVVQQEAAKVAVAKHPTIAVGYTANYAAYVHEMPAGTKWSRPGSGHKWFERNLKRNKNKLLSIVREETKVER